MAIQLNHTIVHAKDKEESATFLSEILGLKKPVPFYHFLVVQLDNGVSLDFLSTAEMIQIQHYAFLISDKEFDEIFSRLKARGIAYYVDPGLKIRGTSSNDGGRGCYFKDPSGHVLEIITRPYGA